jgi:acyl-CoA thioesterase
MVEGQPLAQACADAMWADDRASRALGMKLLRVAPGQAVMQMTVREDMLNGHDICHGGFITTLADSCFAFACNTYDVVTVAAGFDVNLSTAARCGDVLTAEAKELSRTSRTGVYDVLVHNQLGDLVASFRGRSYALKGRSILQGS